MGPPIPEIHNFQNLTSKIQGQGHRPHSRYNTLSTQMVFIWCWWALTFLYIAIKIWPWKSKVKVMVEVNVESHNMGPTFYRLTSLLFHVNQPSHSWDTAFSKIDFENPRSRSWVRWTLKVTTWVQHSIESRLTSLSFHVYRPSHSSDTAFSKFDLENPRSRSWLWSKLKVTKWV